MRVVMVIRSGSLATISCELRQVRKEATVTVISGAEVWLGRVTTLIILILGVSNQLYNISGLQAGLQSRHKLESMLIAW